MVNLPCTHASEEKESEPDKVEEASKQADLQTSTSGENGEKVEGAAQSINEGDGKKEEKESVEEEESLVDDKKNAVSVSQGPAELALLCNAPRDNVIT